MCTVLTLLTINFTVCVKLSRLSKGFHFNSLFTNFFFLHSLNELYILTLVKQYFSYNYLEMFMFYKYLLLQVSAHNNVINFFHQLG